MLCLRAIFFIATVSRALRPASTRCRTELRSARASDGFTGGGSIVPFPAADRILDVLREAEKAGANGEEVGGAFVFEPATPPWAVVHFAGGAALGTYPAVAYGALLQKLADEAGVAVIATPHALSLDHDDAALQISARLTDALSSCRRERGWPTALPLFGVGHSLGARLLLLLEAAAPSSYDRLVLVAPNNYGLAEQARLLDGFLDGFGGSPAETGPLLDALAGAAKLAGLEVSPSPETLLERCGAVEAPAAFLRFDDDDLDSSASIGGAMARSATIEWIPGDHLSPVFVQVGEYSLGSADAVDACAAKIGDLLSAIPERKQLA